MRTVKDILIAARARIAEPDKWTQGAGARAANGSITRVRSKEACRWCVLGAIEVETGPGPDFLAAADAVECQLSDGPWLLSRFNDTHTHAEVLALLDRAIEAA